MNPSVAIAEELKRSLRLASAEADAQRLALLRGRRFLFIMGSYPGKRLMYEHAREVGVSMAVLDGPGHWTKNAVEEGLFECFIEVDLLPTETVAERAFAAIQATELEFDGLATFDDNAGPLVALLAEAMGLPGHSPLSVGFSKNKVFTREVCLQAGIPSPRFFRIKSADDLGAAAAHVGFPAVLKPVSGVSSISTYFLNNEQALRQRYHQTIAEAEGHLKTSGVHSDDDPELIWAKGFDMTLEEFLGGEEFDVDVVLSEGKAVYAEVTHDIMDIRLTSENPLLADDTGILPYLREAGSQMPSDYPLEKQAEMIDFALTVLRALEFTDGTFHVELKYTADGPRLIEVNARIGGGPIYYFHRHVWGVDLVEQYLLTRLGLPVLPRKSPQPLTCLLTSDLPSPRTGTITHTDFLQPVADHPQVIHVKPKVTAGQKVTGPDTGVPDWLGEILVYGPTVEATSQAMDEILSRIEFPIQADH